MICIYVYVCVYIYMALESFDQRSYDPERDRDLIKYFLAIDHLLYLFCGNIIHKLSVIYIYIYFPTLYLWFSLKRTLLAKKY